VSFKETDAGGDGDVEAFDFSGHGDLDEVVAVVFCEASEARAFGPHDDGDRASEVDVVERLVTSVGGASEPEAF